MYEFDSSRSLNSISITSCDIKAFISQDVRFVVSFIPALRMPRMSFSFASVSRSIRLSTRCFCWIACPESMIISRCCSQANFNCRRMATTDDRLALSFLRIL